MLYLCTKVLSYNASTIVLCFHAFHEKTPNVKGQEFESGHCRSHPSLYMIFLNYNDM